MYKNKKILGIVLARSKSKRLVGKNTLNLCGKPLFLWTLHAARKSKYLDNIVISTDDIKIISHTKRLSYVRTIVRTKKLSGDRIASEDVVLDAIAKIKKSFDIIVVLQPTSPLRKSQDIDKAIKKMVNNNAPSIISICYKINNNKNAIELKNGYFRKKNKNNSKGYSVNGAIYAGLNSFFKKKHTFITKKTITYLMPQSRSIDIDNIKDFNLAKKLLKAKQNE